MVSSLHILAPFIQLRESVYDFVPDLAGRCVTGHPIKQHEISGECLLERDECWDEGRSAGEKKCRVEVFLLNKNKINNCLKKKKKS